MYAIGKFLKRLLKVGGFILIALLVFALLIGWPGKLFGVTPLSEYLMDYQATELARQAATAVANDNPTPTPQPSDMHAALGLNAAGDPGYKQTTAAATATPPAGNPASSPEDGYIKVSNLGNFDSNTRMKVLYAGQPIMAYVFFEVAGKLDYLRVVCDDVCTGFTLVHLDGSMSPVTPQYTYGPKYGYSKLQGAELELVKKSGINVADSEILAQNLFVDLAVRQGDRLVVTGHDDPALAVNRQVFVAGVLGE